MRPTEINKDASQTVSDALINLSRLDCGRKNPSTLGGDCKRHRRA